MRSVFLCFTILAILCAYPGIVMPGEEETGAEVEWAPEKATERAAEETAEKEVEKAVEEAAAIEEVKAKRPDELEGPTKVHFVVFVLDIDSIDAATQNFSANVYTRLRWKDRRLASVGSPIRQIDLAEVWNPQVLLANRQGLVSRSLPEVVQVYPDGTVLYHQRYTGILSQPLRLSEFPRDKHVFTIHFVAAGYTADELEFVPDTVRNIVGGSIAEDLSLTDWKILKHEALALPYKPVKELNVAGFAIRFEAERYVAYYIWQVVLPLALVVVMSWAAFWISRRQIGARLGVATSSILTLIAYRFVLASLLPRLPYMTRMDYFTAGSTLLVFLALIAVIVTSYLTGERHEVLSRRVDYIARIASPAVFMLFIGWFLFG